ncbi:MAG: T9SS type A sorting domain-containing protein [Hymenobacteraceae bacterium]|nr:T9SS type A sorting domain-containing protein [Hymenobacteraceae bacterium]
MFNRLLFLFLSLLLTGPALGQYYCQPYINAGYNPGKLNTEAEAMAGLPPAVGWTRLMLGSSALVVAPAWSPVQTLPAGFAFSFDGQPVTAFKVSSNGILTFDLAARAPTWQVDAFPSRYLPNRSVCVWGNLALGRSNATLNTKVFGAAPNRQLWVQYREPRNEGNLRQCWAIVLEETSGVIYVVEQFLNAPVRSLIGVQLSPTSAIAAPGDSTSPSTPSYTWPTRNPLPDDNTYYAFVPGTRPARDLNLRTVRLPRELPPNSGPRPITGTLYNLGSQPVSRCTLSYSVNGGPARAAALTNLALAAGDSLRFRHPANWTPAGPGDYTLRFWTQQPNGQPDQVTRNDTLTTVVHVAARAVPRRVLQEAFSSSTCGYCNPFNDSLRRYNRRNASAGAVHLSYQQNVPAADPYTTPETTARFRYYDGYGVPTLYADGRTYTDSRAPNFDSVMQVLRRAPAYLDLQATYSLTGQTLTASATLTPHAGLDANRWHLYLVINEKSTRDNVRYNGETVFYDVVKKMLPNQYGTLLPALPQGQPLTLSQTYTFPATHTVEHFDSLEVTAFVQNPYTKEVLQTTRARRVIVLGTAPAPEGLACELRPNPAPVAGAALQFTLLQPATIAVEVFNALGQCVFRTAPALPAGAQSVPLHPGRPGVYLVRVQPGGAPARSYRLVVE